MCGQQTVFRERVLDWMHNSSQRVAVLTGSGAAQYSRLAASESADSMSLLEHFLLHLSPSKLRWSHRLKKPHQMCYRPPVNPNTSDTSHYYGSMRFS